jgi:hypothetical protein
MNLFVQETSVPIKSRTNKVMRFKRQTSSFFAMHCDKQEALKTASSSAPTSG